METMTIAIVGGTGTLWRRVAELEARGNHVRRLSRHAAEHHVHLATGDGLGPALAGCDVVVDANNSSARKPAGILVDGSRRLLEAEAAAGVKHHVCVSIVGCDQVPMGYYRAKSDQERLDRALLVPMPVPGTVGRALRSGALTAPRPDVRGTTGCADWLRSVPG
jgi:uncharacterized protein YbjT (DUF2867 family)